MTNSRKTTIAVLFGGRSVEHDVSIVTAQQLMRAMPDSYHVLPVYISREGKWYTGDALRTLENFKDERITSRPDVQPVLLSPDVRHHGFIVNPLASGWFKKPQVQRVDVLFPAVHGTHGEDGTLQGLFELADIPYVGFATLGSALTNDKIMTKQVLRQAGIRVVDDVHFSRAEWQRDADSTMARIKDMLPYPVFVKPATLGSSIGVGRADNDQLLRASIEVALGFDRRVLVESAVTQSVEINCSVIGYGQELQASVLEQPLSWSDFLAFEDKYLRGSKGMQSQARVIPAPLAPELSAHIQEIAKRAFQAVDGRGITRVDFLVRPEQGEVFLNELNTLPGSLAFYLWEASGVPAGELIDRLVRYAREAYAEKRASVYDYKNALLSVATTSGTKGAKGSKTRA